MIPSSQSDRVIALTALCLGALVSVTAQVAPTVPPPSAPPVETIELSPFVVSAVSDNGYQATQTLAGTRLKTDLRDIAASVQILTPEFLDDVGANNLNELFIYTTNTEASGLNGNFSNATPGSTSVGDASTRVDPQGSQRVRGLASADVTRNYFLTLIPTDRFNTERVEINRGANAILFGLGSPAGIANTGMSSAQFRNFGQTKIHVDSEGSFRTELDINRELIKKRLAVRAIALRDETKYYQRPAFQDDQRLYLAMAARPWTGAVVRGFYENGKRDANRPNTVPLSNSIDSWFQSGATVRDLMRKQLATAGINLTVPDNLPLTFYATLQDLFTANYLTVADVNRDGAINAKDDQDRLSLLMHQIAYFQDPNNRYLFHPNASRQVELIYQYNQAEPTGGAGGANTFMSNVNSAAFSPALRVVPASLDPSGNRQFGYPYLVSQQPWRQNPLLVPESMSNLQMFDFTRNMVGGESAFQNDKWKHYNASFEQTGFNDRIGIELAVDRQSYRRENFVPFQGFTGLFVDTMKNYLGQPNPNYGRPFIQTRSNLGELVDDRTNVRATAFARFTPANHFPASRLARWLGDHTFTTLFNKYDQTSKNTSRAMFYTDTNGGSIFGPTDAQGSQRRQVNYVAYLSDQNLTTLSSADEVRLNRMQNQRLWNPGQTAVLQTVDSVTGSLVNTTLNTGVFATSYSENQQRVKSYAGNWNSYFFDRHLVGLLGWRRDDAYSAGYDALIGADQLADLNKLALTSGGTEQSVNTFSWSGVAHMPDRFLPRQIGLSFHYGVSQNFSLGATPLDFFGKGIPSASGNTKEYGFTVNLLNNKVVARVNWFASELINRPLTGTSNVYNRFANQGILGIYAGLIESEFYGFRAPSVNPVTGLPDPGTPHYALAMQGLAELRKIIPASLIEQAGLASVTPEGLSKRGNSPGIGDTEDVSAKGLEIELTYNPTRNWRISASIAKQETVIANYSPRMAELMAATDKLIGPNGSLAKLAFFNDASVNPPTYISVQTPTNNSIAQWLETNVYSIYRLYKQQEGRVSDEQRKWRVNLVTNYEFRTGRLKGFGVGTAYRWQDGAAIGYPSQLVDGLLVADITRPHMAPGETNVDAWVRYKRRIFSGKLDWEIELRVQNLNTGAENLIPVQSTRDANYRVAVWRVGPPQVWRLTNSFKF
jgi:hypothetical protein